MSFRFHPTIRFAICVLIAFAAAALALSYASEVFNAVRHADRLQIPAEGYLALQGFKFEDGGIDVFRPFLRIAPAFLVLAVSVIAWHLRKPTERKEKRDRRQTWSNRKVR